MDRHRLWYAEHRELVTSVRRARLLTYGSAADRVLLEAFDRLGEILGSLDGSGEATAVPGEAEPRVG